MVYENLNEAIKKETKEQTVSIWGDEVTFTPVLISEKLGNGKQLIQIGAIDFRPLYYLMLIDNHTDLDNFDSDEIALIIENEVGELTDEELESEKSNIELYPKTRFDGIWFNSVFK